MVAVPAKSESLGRLTWNVRLHDVVERCGERGDHARYRFTSPDERGYLVWYTRVSVPLRIGEGCTLTGSIEQIHLHPATREEETIITRCRIARGD